MGAVGRELELVEGLAAEHVGVGLCDQLPGRHLGVEVRVVRDTLRNGGAAAGVFVLLPAGFGRPGFDLQQRPT